MPPLYRGYAAPEHHAALLRRVQLEAFAAALRCTKSLQVAGRPGADPQISGRRRHPRRSGGILLCSLVPYRPQSPAFEVLVFLILAALSGTIDFIRITRNFRYHWGKHLFTLLHSRNTGLATWAWSLEK